MVMVYHILQMDKIVKEESGRESLFESGPKVRFKCVIAVVFLGKWGLGFGGVGWGLVTYQQRCTFY